MNGITFSPWPVTTRNGVPLLAARDQHRLIGCRYSIAKHGLMVSSESLLRGSKRVLPRHHVDRPWSLQVYHQNVGALRQRIRRPGKVGLAATAYLQNHLTGPRNTPGSDNQQANASQHRLIGHQPQVPLTSRTKIAGPDRTAGDDLVTDCCAAARSSAHDGEELLDGHTDRKDQPVFRARTADQAERDSTTTRNVPDMRCLPRNGGPAIQPYIAPSEASTASARVPRTVPEQYGWNRSSSWSPSASPAGRLVLPARRGLVIPGGGETSRASDRALRPPPCCHRCVQGDRPSVMTNSSTLRPVSRDCSKFCKRARPKLLRCFSAIHQLGQK